MVFSPKQESPNPSKRCKFFTSTLKDAFTNCHIFKESHSSTQSSDEDDAIDDYDDEEEVFVSIVISKYIESKCRRQTTISSDKFNWTFSPTAGDLFISTKLMQQKEDKEHQEKEENEDFFSVGTRLSRCSSAKSYEAFATAKTTLSRSSSLNRIDFQDFPRRSVIQEFSHCEGWPFGLCRKLLLLPPLPKSPSDSWSWRKSARMIKIH
ncbi:PREDICTED: uncharacterized protein LOC109224956 [Nicotiana attenuata]|uniref:Uncharacterized protein n=1 Tax=Nicotiana attenuata TaxID=49451 RepID=A0A1J6IGD5_NICAT|nr:PREDICTED: uncharacterized protein LOC109224956 [Nicotiana attenuata]OIT04133.1 hypothetical protein A4A49_11027 [Nicotiana attenuata]